MKAQKNHFTLSFNGKMKHLESVFREDYFNSSIMQLRTATITLTIVYLLFTFADMALDPSNFVLFLRVRWFIVGPLGLFLVWSTFQRWFKSVSQLLPVVALLSGALTTVFFILKGNLSVSIAYNNSFYLTLICMYALFRIRFIWAFPTGLLIFSVYIFTSLYVEIPRNIILLNLVFQSSFVLLGSIVCYNLELLARNDFLSKYYLSKEYSDLEVRVVERTKELENSHNELMKEMNERALVQERLLHIQRLESIGLLAGGVAHDFNNILAGILGSVYLVKSDQLLPPAIDKHFNDIKVSADRAVELARQLLAFSRQQDMETNTLDVNQLINRLFRMLKRIIGEHISIELNLSENIGMVLVDSAQLEQVITNLVVNAGEAMQAGGTLILSTKSIKDEIYISISDTGIGMNSETLSKIFDPFFTTKEMGIGAGLGLAVSFGIIEQFSGRITVTSQENKGSVFTIILPEILERN